MGHARLLLKGNKKRAMQEIEIKSIHIGKGEVKPFQFAGDMTFHIEKSKEFTKKLLE